MSTRYIVGDVFEQLALLEPGSADLVVTSPPFLALRSYLPADHEHKSLEIGSEATPGAFIDRMLDVVEACARVLAPHGSLVFELGDTYAGNGGEYHRYDSGYSGHNVYPVVKNAEHPGGGDKNGPGWPLDKSKVLIPQLFAIALAYGFNPLTGRPTEPWRVRNTVAWCRPNPPVGRDGDKFRPATSTLTVACKARDRYWDGDAVRVPIAEGTHAEDRDPDSKAQMVSGQLGGRRDNGRGLTHKEGTAGAPLLDYWVIPTAPSTGARTVHRVRVPADALCDGIQRTTSPDCPVHGSAGHPGSSAPDGEREADSSSRTEHTDRLAPEQLPDFVPTEQTTAPLDLWGSSSLPDAPAAKTRSKAVSRTVPVPATTPADTPSAQTPDGTERTSTSPELSAPDPDNGASSNAPDDSPGGFESGTEPRIADTRAQPGGLACTCSYHVDISLAQNSNDYATSPPEMLDYWVLPTHGFKGSHYATYPPDLVVPLVKAMCPRRVCRVCGEPSRRIVDVDGLSGHDFMGGPGRVNDRDVGHQGNRDPMPSITRTTLGWSDCGHDNWRPGLVLDPFAGSGTTLAVASGHGLDSIGIDLDERNAWLARERIGMFCDIETPEARAFAEAPVVTQEN